MRTELRPDVLRTDKVDRYLAAMLQEGLWSSEPALRRYLCWLFKGRVIGWKTYVGHRWWDGCLQFLRCGDGDKRHHLPGAGIRGLDSRDERAVRSPPAALLAFTTCALIRDTLQNLEAPTDSFHVALLHNSINHLDEGATIRLRDDARSREVYRNLFRKLAWLLAPRGYLLITDCARMNLFPLLRIPHPISRSIEWHKHQDPGLWAALLRDAGFTEPVIGWSAYNRLGRLGWTLLANRAGAFFGTGHFRLLMRNGG